MLSQLYKSTLLTLWCTCFTIIVLQAQKPVVTSFTPAKGAAGTTLTITGTGFNPTAANNIVSFSGVAGTVSTATATSLTVTIPSGAQYGQLTVQNTVNGLLGKSTGFFSPAFAPIKQSIQSVDFGAAATVAANASPGCITVADFDGDGKPDVFMGTSNAGGAQSAFLQNNASAGTLTGSSFRAAVLNSSIGSANMSAAGDLDGDGKPDLVVGGSYSLTFYRNTATPSSFNSSSFPQYEIYNAKGGVALADLDGDGRLDVIAYDGSNLWLIRNLMTAAGNFSASSFAAPLLLATPASGVYFDGLAVQDFNGDGKADIAVGVRATTNNLMLLTNQASSGSLTTSSFAAPVYMTVGSQLSKVVTGDLDSDGHPDLIVQSIIGTNGLYLMRNNGTSGALSSGSFETPVLLSGSSGFTNINLGDFDGDGAVDLFSAWTYISIMRNQITTPGAFTASSFAAATQLSYSPLTVTGAVAVDMDGDGKPDLAASSRNSSWQGMLMLSRNNPVPVPVVTSFTPQAAATSSLVTISGQALNNVTSATIGGVSATITNNIGIGLQLTVPSGAASGAIVLTHAGGTVNAGTLSIVGVPNISVSPNTRNLFLGTAATITPINNGGALPSGASLPLVTTMAGNGTGGNALGTGTVTRFQLPYGVAAGPDGSVYVADHLNNRVVKVSPSNVATNFAGNGSFTLAVPSGAAASAGVGMIASVAVDKQGNVYLLDGVLHRIYKVDAAGTISLLAGSSSGSSGNANGTGSAASFYDPQDIAVDDQGNLYVADAGNNLIRMITPAGVVTTLAGSGMAATTDGTGAGASFENITGITVDASGDNIYVSQSNPSIIRKITAQGVVSLLAGSVSNSGDAEGTGTNARFSNPQGLGMDANGNILVADQGNNRIRMVTPAGVVTTYAGNLHMNNSYGNRNGLTDVTLYAALKDVAGDASGNVYAVEIGNHQLRRHTPQGYQVQPALPAGLSINPATGTISGTPTTLSAATTYTIRATNVAGSASTQLTLTVSLPPPAITSIAPASGQIGTLITLTGTGLDAATTVTVGGVNAVVVSNTATQITAMVMPGAVSGSASVTNSRGTSTSAANFTILPGLLLNTQQGSKLVGTGNTGAAEQGVSVALSADGNTMAVGAISDDGGKGAVWIYTRSGTTWVQQGNKLVGTGGAGNGQQGSSVALSADGNTVAIGAHRDNSNMGAVWVFTRTGNIWAQQGNKLVGTVTIGLPYQGTSVALSADGNTLAVGGYGDNFGVGATWIFTRSANTWSQQGSKLMASGAAGSAYYGFAVSLSADGNTLAVGGYGDNGSIGATWIHTRSNGAWTQQGSKLVGSNSSGAARQGAAISLSADGNTLAVGGYFHSGTVGGTWIFTRGGSAWSEQAGPLIGSGAVGSPFQGFAVALNANGTTLAAGALGDASFKGATWIFNRIGTSWSQGGSKLVGTTASTTVRMGRAVALSADGMTLAVGGNNDDNSNGAAWVFVPMDPPSAFSYTPASASVTAGAVITPINPSITGTIHSYSVVGTPLPAGLTLNTTTGIISGTPTALASTASYTIQAVNTSGAATTQVGLTVTAATPVIGVLTISNRVYGAPDFTISQPSSNSSGTFSYNSSNPLVAIIVNGNRINIVGAGTTTITATQAATGIYNSGSVQTTFTVNTATPAIGVVPTTPVSVVYGSSSLSLQPSSANTAGAYSYTTTDGTVASADNNGVISFGNVGSATLTISQAAAGNYAAAILLVPVVVTPASPTIGALALPAATYGDPTFALTDPATNSGGGFTFTSSDNNVAQVSGNTVTIVGAGTATITATKAATTNYTTGSVQATLTVAPATPAITQPAAMQKVMGSGTFQLPDPASTGTGGWSWTTGNPQVATVSGNTVTLTGLGAATLTATQAATANYTAGSTTLALTVVSGNPGLASFALPAKTYGDAPFVLTDPASNSQGWFTYASSDNSVATVSGSQVTIVGAGSAVITATQAAWSYYPSGTISAALVVAKANPTVAQPAGIAKVYGDANFTLPAPQSNSNGAWSYTSSNTNVVGVAGNTATISGAGAATITATQAATANYNGAVTTFTVAVAKANPVIGQPAALGKVYGDAAFTLAAPQSNSPGAWSYTSANTSVATINGNTITIVGTGTTTITATQAATANYNGGGTSYTLAVTPAPAAAGMLAPIGKVYGDAPFALAAPQSASPATWSFSSSNPQVASISGNTVTIVGAGQATITASQAATANYTAATVTTVITVAKANPAIAVLPVMHKTYGDAPYTIAAPQSSSPEAFSFSSSNTAVATISGNRITITGAGSATITATQPTGANYMGGSVQAVLTVTPAPLTLTVKNAYRCVGYTNPQWGYTISGFINGENASILTAQPQLATTAITASAAGNYAINATGAQAANYNIGYVPGVLTVNNPQHTAQRLPTVDAIAGERTPLSARMFGTAYQWSPATGLSNDRIALTTTTLTDEVTYRIATTEPTGCVVTDTLQVRTFSKPDVFVPTLFSPNGDGVNETLCNNAVGLRQIYYWRVLDRQGRLLFETRSHGQCWDGRYKGQLQPMGTYQWIMLAQDKDGKTIGRSGSVTLVR